MTAIVIVNASKVLRDAEAATVVAALQVADDALLRPAWGFDPCTYSFMPFGQMPAAGDPRWPIFLNNSSADPSVGGFHDDQSGVIFGRCFVGDCIRYGISWTVDVSHESFELRGNPTINKTVTLGDGRVALAELADPVEDDALAIDVNGIKISDFVLPAYFSVGPGPWDYQKKLAGPCPTLLPGGYQSLYEGGAWTQVTAMYLGGPLSYRATRYSARHRAPKFTP